MFESDAKGFLCTNVLVACLQVGVVASGEPGGEQVRRVFSTGFDRLS